MTEFAKTLYQFFSSFGIPAYLVDHVPDNAVLPYITYTAENPLWDSAAMNYCQLWYPGTSFTDVNAKVDEIGKDVGFGKIIKTQHGFVRIAKGDPWCQPMSTASNIVSEYLNFEVQNFIPE